MVHDDTSFAYKQSTASDEFFIPIDPNIEILMRLVSREGNMHAFDNATTL